MLKRILNLFVFLTLVSCINTGARETSAVVVNTQVIPTGNLLPPTPFVVVNTKMIATVTLPSPIVAVSVTPTITPTPEPPCDPFTVDFCITDGHFLLQRPIRPPANDLIDPIYGYGSTANGTREPHHGVEFSNPSGTPVYAAGDGTVIFAGPDDEAVYAPWRNFYGNLVVIEHPDGLFTLYAHLSKIEVQAEEQNVFAGDKIGEVGRTGGAIGSHLHFEVRRGDGEDYFATQNPELWLTPAKDENGRPFGTLMISLLNGDGNLVEDANFTIGYYSDPTRSPIKFYYATPYSPDMLMGKENIVLDALSAGDYRIAVETNGQILERWVEVESGKLTQVVFVIR
jgi:hypothetical protein